MVRGKIYFDGSCLPKNPGGIACFGVVAVDGNNVRIKEKWGIVSEHGTNNIAEWKGLIESLKLARELGWKDVKILGDSQLVVNQFNGLWQIKKNHLRKFFEEAHQEILRVGKVEVSWIPRAKNLADPVCHKAFVEHVENRARKRAMEEIEKYSVQQVNNSCFKVVKQDNKRTNTYKLTLSPSFSCTCPFFVRYNSYPLLKRSKLKVRCKHFFVVENFLKK